MMHKFTLSVYYNQGLKCLNTQINELINQNSIIVPKVFKPTNKIAYLGVSSGMVRKNTCRQANQKPANRVQQMQQKVMILNHDMGVLVSTLPVSGSYNMYLENNKYITTRMLHQIFMFSLVKCNSQLAKIMIHPIPFPPTGE